MAISAMELVEFIRWFLLSSIRTLIYCLRKANKLDIDLEVISSEEKMKIVCNILIWIGHGENLLSFIFCTHYTVIVEINPENRHNYYEKYR